MSRPDPAVAAARVCSIPAGAGFLDSLARGLVERYGAAPDGLRRVTVLLPTRRAVVALRDAFLRLGEGRPMLLPALQPIGDVDEDELLLDRAGAFDLDLPPAVPALRRQLLLQQLVQGWSGLPAVQAAPLARELTAFFDLLQREDVDLQRLDDLVPAEYAEHWQLTLDFLKVAAEPWSAIMAAEGAMDPVARRNRLIRAQAESWRAAPPAGPVVAAGTTGSVPATAELLAVVATLPQGIVVLPGLDVGLDEESWAALAEDHPQFGMQQLLVRLGVERADVASWRSDEAALPESPRARLIREALRPAATTDRWRDTVPLPAGAADGLLRIDCPGEHEEALTIALMLREALETPRATAALVTPDRLLARRVAAELRRWQVDVDDSAGQPLRQSASATLLRLAAEAVAEEFAPVELLALLKHPLAAAGRRRADLRALARLLDRKALRGPRPAPGIAGLRQAIAGSGIEAQLTPLLDELERHAGGFADLLAGSKAELPALLRAHLGFLEWLGTDADGEAPLWRGEAGETLAEFCGELLEAAEGLPPLETIGYPVLIAGLMEGRVVRPRFGLHPRLSIWGPLEARLQRPDLLILGGLNEGTWPAPANVDAWLSRPMRSRLGLPSPERRTGLSAHDFAQGVAAPRVVLTRAEKAGGAPTVPSRWLLRLEQVLDGAGRPLPKRDAARWLDWQQRLDYAGTERPVLPPEIRPPVEDRPRGLSVTRIELWMRDPYAIFARYILKLTALDPIAADPGAAERGIAIHEALDAFVRAYPGDLPANARAELTRCGEAAFGPLLDRPGIRAIWWPRFERIADWFIASERRRRTGQSVLQTEVKGRLELQGPAGPFILSATADRIDRLNAGGLVIIDYKTGTLPTAKEVERGDAPQLPLEAAIALAGGFPGVPAEAIDSLAFWKLSGGRIPGEEKPLKLDVAAAAEAAREGLLRLIAEFDNRATPYRARPRPAAAPRFSDYDHLARVKEWSAGGPGDW